MLYPDCLMRTVSSMPVYLSCLSTRLSLNLSGSWRRHQGETEAVSACFQVRKGTDSKQCRINLFVVSGALSNGFTYMALDDFIRKNPAVKMRK